MSWRSEHAARRAGVPDGEHADVESGRHCSRCYGLPWRVQGIRCRCGLRFAHEVVEVPIKHASNWKDAI